MRNSPSSQFDGFNYQSGGRLSGSLLSEGGDSVQRGRMSVEGGGSNASNFARDENAAEQFRKKQSLPSDKEKVSDPFAAHADPKVKANNDFDPFKQFNG